LKTVHAQGFKENALFDQAIISSVIADPKPRGRVSFKHAQGPIAEADPERPDMALRFDTFKPEGWVEKIFFPDLKSFLGSLPSGIRQLMIAFPE
jgi:hypothetical protein